MFLSYQKTKNYLLDRIEPLLNWLSIIFYIFLALLYFILFLTETTSNSQYFLIFIMSLSLIALTTTKSNLNFARPFSYEITIANIDNERTSMKHDIIVVRTDTKLENYGKDETFIFNKRILNFIESKNGWNPENTLIVLVVRVT